MDMLRLSAFRAALIFSLVPCGSHAQTRAAHVFGTNMVLQRDAKVPVWGWASPGQTVTVSIQQQNSETTVGKVTVSSSQQTCQTTADAAGRWQVELKPLAVTTNAVLRIVGDVETVFENVAVGDVFLCSGQSNMAMTVSRAAEAEKEIAAANHPQIRLLTIGAHAAADAQPDCKTSGWKPCSPQSVGSFSATAYYFGRDIQEHAGVPVGLICSAWGGTCVEAWTEAKELAAVPTGLALIEAAKRKAAEWDQADVDAAFEAKLARWRVQSKASKAEGKRPQRQPRKPVRPSEDPNTPGNLFNGMIAPLAPFAIKGAVWYQGERNSNNVQAATDYRTHLAIMIDNWRRVWAKPDLPFLFVQLPNFAGKAEPCLALNRESMLTVWRTTPNTGMAITIDIGDATDIHPKNKQEVGRRLALLARRVVYRESLVYSGPVFEKATYLDTRALLTFTHTGDGLKTSDGQALREMEVAGEDRVFVPAQAVIEGRQLAVRAADGRRPCAVRYAWKGNPDANLCNSATLPASPFRTDAWPANPPPKP